MTYRDEKGALSAKVDELEGQLEAANAEIAALSGTRPAPAIVEGETLGETSGLGVPSSLRIEKVLDFTLTPEGYEAIAALLESRLRLKSAQVGHKLTTLEAPRQSLGRVEISVKDGRTHLVLERSWNERAAAPWIFSGMLAMFGSFAVAGVLHDVAHLSDVMAFANVLWSAPLIVAGTAPLFRRHARGQVEAELAERRGAFAAMVALAEAHRATPPVRARVEVAGEHAEPEPHAEAELSERGGSR